MALTREMDSPLLSEDDALRRAALLQLAHIPTQEGAKAIIEALLYFLRERPQSAEEFEHALYTPPLAPLAEDPILKLLDEPEDAVREEAAFILYRMRIRASSRARVAKALTEDKSHWVRAYCAKALAMLPGANAGAQLAEQIDSEATLESIARMGEALALLGNPEQAAVLREQAEQLRERSAPNDAGKPELWVQSAGELALFLEALAAKLDGQLEEGAQLSERGAAWSFEHPEFGKILVAGGLETQGYAAFVARGDKKQAMVLDSPEAQAKLERIAWP